ncbi:Fyv7/TAP26 [Dillenia turbinata]|uniref:Fyv7/TAP26 n=1 Tax=Dillenia turbinata TaxID=194707 RepID=A0AAN8VX72_9MAGN
MDSVLLISRILPSFYNDIIGFLQSMVTILTCCSFFVLRSYLEQQPSSHQLIRCLHNSKKLGFLLSHTTKFLNVCKPEKQREFNKNEKYVKKYKRYLKQQGGLPNYPSSDTRANEHENISDDTDAVVRDKKSKKNKNSSSLEALYEKKHEEQEKARIEKEAVIQAKKEESERVEFWRKALREKMLKQTRSGQPVMKYRIEHLLETIQGSKS